MLQRVYTTVIRKGNYNLNFTVVNKGKNKKEEERVQRERRRVLREKREKIYEKMRERSGFWVIIPRVWLGLGHGPNPLY